MTSSPLHWHSLVTGGCGLIGRTLCRRLIDLGHHVTLIDNLSTGSHPDLWLGDWDRQGWVLEVGANGWHLDPFDLAPAP